MKKIILGILAVAAVGFGIWKLQFPKVEATSDKPTIKIGASLPLTGGLANIGNAAKNTILIAQEDLKRRNLKNNYEFIIEDDAFEVRKVATNFNKFQSIDKVDALTSFASATGNVIAPLSERNKIIYLNFGASDVKIAEGKYNFINWNLPEDMAIGMVNFYVKKGFKKVAFIAENDAGVIAIEKGFRERTAERGIETKTYFTQPKEKDFRLLLSKIENDFNPDVYLVMVWSESLTPFVKQYKEAGINKLITNLETFGLFDDLALVEGTYYVDSGQTSEDLTQRIQALYPDTSTDFATGNVYDNVMLIVEAFEKADTKDKAVDELIKTKEYKGISKTLLQDEIGIFHSDAIIKKIINGKKITVEE